MVAFVVALVVAAMILVTTAKAVVARFNDLDARVSAMEKRR